MKFIGPAQKEHNSLRELAFSYLNHYCPNWNDLDHPRSYIFPPLFSFKYDTVSDQKIDEMRNARKINPFTIPPPEMKHRIGDYAEYKLFQVIQELTQKEWNVPFVSIHSLNIGNNRDHLGDIFEIDNFANRIENMKIGEYDFILLSPNGIAIIEAKSCDFRRPKKDFVMEKKYLPGRYMDGINQMSSFEKFFEFVKDYCKIEPTRKIQVQKILFTPNLEKARYKEWFDSLNQDAQDFVRKKIGSCVQLFKEDEDQNASW